MGVTGKHHVPFRSGDGDGTAAAPATAAPITEHVRHVVATQPDEKKQICKLERV